MASHACRVIRTENWRSPRWDDDIPPRPGYDVICAICGSLPKDGELYASGARARGVATRHERVHGKSARRYPGEKVRIPLEPGNMITVMWSGEPRPMVVEHDRRHLRDLTTEEAGQLDYEAERHEDEVRKAYGYG